MLDDSKINEFENTLADASSDQSRLAWCSNRSNLITIYDIKHAREIQTFTGAQLTDDSIDISSFFA